jgi:hypothetical protein
VLSLLRARQSVAFILGIGLAKGAPDTPQAP